MKEQKGGLAFSAFFIIVFLIVAVPVFFLPDALWAEPLDNWHKITPLPQSKSLSGIAFGNGIYVAVGYEGTIMTSADASSWTNVSSGTDKSLYGIVYNSDAGTFVAVGSAGTLLTSANGTEWTARSSNTTNGLSSIDFGNGMYVAVGSSGTILTSSDSINWTPRTSNTTNSLSGIAHSAGTFVAVGYSGTILTSTDALSWTKITPVPAIIYDLYGVAYGNGKFVAVGLFGKAYVSTTGATWTAQSTSTTSNLYKITYDGNNKFIAVGSSGTILTSDGTTWTKAVSGISNYLLVVVYANSSYVAVGEYGRVITSSDGTTWTSKTPGTNDNFYGIAYGNGAYVAVGGGGTIITSADGISWTLRSSGVTTYLNRVAFANGIFVAAGDSGVILTSANGIDWTKRASGITSSLYGVAYGNGTYVAGGDSGIYLTSANGETWTAWSLGITNGLRDVVFAKNIFAVTTDLGRILAFDGTSWASTDSVTTYWGDITFGNDIFIAVGNAGVIQTSLNGINWTSRTSGATAYWLGGVAYDSGSDVYVVAGSAGTILTSSDAATWTRRASAVTNNLNRIIYVNGRFICVGDYGAMQQSDSMFKPVYPLTVTKSGAGGGAVSATGLTCNGNTCTGTYESGTSVTVTAAPDTGSMFAGWAGDCSGNASTCTLTIDASKNVTAAFNVDTSVVLTVLKSGNGTVTTDTGALTWSRNTGTARYDNGSKVTIIAVSDASAAFEGWAGDCLGSASTCTLVLDVPKTVGANFTVVSQGSLVGTMTPLRTGQTLCYNAAGVAVACSGTGQDGDIQAGSAWPDPRFTMGSNNTADCIEDSLTGLMWAKNGNLSNGVKFWQEAVDFIKNFNTNGGLCGYTDWRIPNINEMESLINGGAASSVDWLVSQGFTNIQTEYHSSTALLSNLINKWYIHMPSGVIYSGCGSYYVLPVRSSRTTVSGFWKTGQKECYNAAGPIACNGTTMQDGEFQTGVSWPDQRFIDNNDETVGDKLTGLIWTKGSKTPGPAACTPATAKTWQGALDYIQCLNTEKFLGYDNWRLPNRKELLTLIDRSKATPALPSGHPFGTIENIDYWTSTTSAGKTTDATIINTYYGTMQNKGKAATTNHVWPVRDQVAAKDLPLSVSAIGSGSGAVTSSPAGINCGSACFGKLRSGSMISLIAMPDQDSTFTGWSGSCTNTTSVCTVTMDVSRNVTATFTVKSGFLASAGPITAVKGTSGSSDVTFTSTGGFDSPINITVEYSGTAPSDASFDISSTSVTPTSGGVKVSVNFIAGNNTPAGSYAIRITAVSGDTFRIVEIPVTVAPVQGYAILLQGNKTGASNSTYTASLDDIYKRLLRRYFKENDIYYLNSEGTGHTGVSALSTKQNMQFAVTEWARSRVTESGAAPLYIILTGNGSDSKFYTDHNGAEEYITPDELNAWISVFEGNDPSINSVIAIGSNYSGSFLPALSKSGRVTISSSASNEPAVQGPSDNSKFYGDFFLYYLFSHLEEGENLKGAFQKASADTALIMECRTCGLDIVTGSPIVSYQRPLLDDNGDHSGTWDMNIGEDGDNASKIIFGIGTGLPHVAVQEVMPTYTIAPGSGDLLTAWAKIEGSPERSWVEVKGPSFNMPTAVDTGHRRLQLPIFTGSYNASEQRWEYSITGLIEPGTYRIFYYASDAYMNITPPNAGAIYVDSVSNQAPQPFTLIGPGCSDCPDTDPRFDLRNGMMIFNWNKAVDDDPVTYTVRIYEDNNGSPGTEIKTYEMIRDEILFVNGYEKKSDGSEVFISQRTFWWKVEAIDNKGKKTVSGYFKFKRNFTIPHSGIITGIMYSDIDASRITGASVGLNILGSAAISLSSGTFMLNVPVPPGSETATVSLTGSSSGYQDTTLSGLSIKPGEVMVVNVKMTQMDVSANLGKVIKLTKGWNFISIAVQPDDTSIEDVLKEVSPNVRVVWGFDNQNKTWKRFRPPATSYALSAIESGKGYWVYMDQAATLSIAGQLAGSQTVTIFPGWNLVGFNGQEGTLPLPESCIIIWGWENGQWSAKTASDLTAPTVPELASLSKGKAYWIKIKAQTDWNQ